MAENNFSALVKLVVDKAQARSALQKELKELQKEAQLETDVKVNLSDVRQARKEIAQANKEQQEGTRENIKLRAQELAHTKMLAKETKAATDLELSSRERVRKLNDQTFKEESSARKKAIQETKLQAQEQKALIESLNTSEKKINRKIKNESYDTNIDKIKKQFQDYGLTVDQAEEKVSVLRSTLSEMQTLSGDSLIKKADEWEKAFADVKVQLDKTKLAYDQLSEVNKIQRSLDTEKYSKDVTKINNELSKVGKFTLSDQKNKDVFKEANDSAKLLKTTYDQLKSTMDDTNATDQQKIQIENQYQQALERTKNLISQINFSKDDEKVSVTDNRRTNMIATLNNYLSKNTAMTRDSKKQIESWIATLSSSDDMTVGAIKNINSEFKQLDATLRASGKLGLSTWDKLKKVFEKFGGWSLATGAMTRMFQEVKKGVQFIGKLDDALTDVAYTSNASIKQLENLGNSAIDMAKDLNTSAENILEAVKIYSTANSTAEDILRKSKPAIMLSNVSGMSGSESSKTINTALNQFELEDTEEGLMDIVDTLEYVSSQLNYDFTEGIKEITEGIEASGSVAKNAGLDMQEYATMVGIAVEKTGQKNCPCM